MAPYSTTDDLQVAAGSLDRLNQLFAYDRSSIIADPTLMANAIDGADRVIDSYLVKQFLVPLAAPVPVEIRDVSARLAVTMRRFRVGMMDPGVEKMHDADVKWLESIRDGNCALSVAPQPVASTMRLDAQLERPLSKDVSRKKLYGFS